MKTLLPLKQLKIKLILVFISCIFSGHVAGQHLEWAASGGNPTEQDGAILITMDPSGNIIQAGIYADSASFGPFSLHPPPFYSINIFIVKMNPAGVVLWATGIAGKGYDAIYGLGCDAAGNIYASAASSDTSFIANDTLLPKQAFLAKLDANGNFTWGKPRYGSYFAQGQVSQSIYFNSSNECIITSGYNDTSVVNNDTLPWYGSHDAVVAKYDINGQPVWYHTIGGSASDYVYNFAMDSSGNIYISMSLEGYNKMDGVPFEFTFNGTILLKFDDSGNLLNYRLIDTGGNSDTYITYSVADNKIYAGISFTGTLDLDGFTFPSLPSLALAVVRLDTSFYCEQAHLYSNPDQNWVYHLSCFSNKIYLAGIMEGPGVLGPDSIDTENYPLVVYFASFDTTCNVSWARYFHGDYYANFPDGLWNDGNYLYMGATLAGPFSYEGTVFQSGSNSSDVFLFKFRDDSIGNYNQLSGKVFSDDNANGILDAGEQGIPNSILKLDPLHYHASSNNSGDFSMISSSGNYNLSIIGMPLYRACTNPVTGNYSVFFPGDSMVIDTLNFGLHPVPGIYDLRASVNSTALRINANTIFYLNAANAGTETILNPVIDFNFDTLLTYVSSSHVPVVNNTGHISWTLDSLQPMQNEQVTVELFVTPQATFGDTSTCHVTLLPLINDTTPADNEDSLAQVFTNSIDPNIKVNEPQGTGINGNIPMSVNEMEYTIHFQNTGNDTAYIVTIVDSIDTQVFDLASLQLLASSHSFEFSVYGIGVLAFTFNNIMLPDSGADYTASQGFVSFKIKLKDNLVPGTQLLNEAYIYFDLNPAVITNTTVNTLINTTGIFYPAVTKKEIKIIPNPLTDFAEIIVDKPFSHGEIIIYNSFGTEMKRDKMNDGSYFIRAGDFSRGIYFVKIYSDSKKELSAKFLVIK